MKQKQESLFFSHSNIDLYNFNEITREWNLDCIQLKPGKFTADLTQLITPNFQLGHVKFNLATKQEGVSPEGVWTFAFVKDKSLFWRNYKLKPQSVIIYAPGSEVNAVSSADFEVTAFSVPDFFLQEIAKKINVETFYNSLKNIELLETKGSLWKELRLLLLKELRKHKQDSTYQTDMEFIENFSRDLLVLLEDSIISTTKVSSKKRLKSLRESEEYVLLHIIEPFSVLDVASSVGVSQRTLLYAFNNRFGLGTKAFIKVLKLNHVYHALHKENNNVSVALIARASGFWHMGQFYKDYKKFFGELPSVTLNANISDCLMQTQTEKNS